VCDHAYCLDQQYWVRDDGKGGQLIKAKCGADVELQLFRGIDPQPLLQPDVKVKVSSGNNHWGAMQAYCVALAMHALGRVQQQQQQQQQQSLITQSHDCATPMCVSVTAGPTSGQAVHAC
jgi:hypothetical protein